LNVFKGGVLGSLSRKNFSKTLSPTPEPTPSPTFLSPNPLSNFTQQFHRARIGTYFTLLPL